MSTIGPKNNLNPVDSKPAARDARVDEVSKLYEKQFLREMVKAMRQTVSHAEMNKPSMGEEIFRGELDNQYVEQWGDQGGIGLADMIYTQMMSRYFEDNSAEMQKWKSHGQVPLTERDKVNVMYKTDVGGNLQAKATLPGGQAETLLNPFEGRVFYSQSSPSRSLLGINTDFGLQSVLEVPGWIRPIENGQSLKAGEKLATLSPEIKDFFWNFRRLK